jgi:hypothetical protein
VDAEAVQDDVLLDIPDADRDGDPEKYMARSEIGEELYEAIRALPNKSRETFIMHYVCNMKYRDIAKATDTSIKTVSTNLIRAKKHLKAYLREHYPDIEVAPLSAILPIAAIAAKLEGIAAAGKGILTALTNAPGPVAAGTAGIVCAASVTYAVIANDIPNYAIALESESCECGHINPEHIGIKGTKVGDSAGGWEVADDAGKAVFAGSLAEVTDYIIKMRADDKDGLYQLRCVVTNKSGKTYNVTREIAIGDYAGDL